MNKAHDTVNLLTVKTKFSKKRLSKYGEALQ